VLLALLLLKPLLLLWLPWHDPACRWLLLLLLQQLVGQQTDGLC
jgi:hypothetical protein